MCKRISITQTQLILMWLQSDKSIAETQSLEYPHPLTYCAKWSDKDQDLGPKIGTGIGAYCIVGFSSTYVVISLVRWIDITANFHFPFLWRSLWSQVARFCTSAEQCCFSGGCWHADPLVCVVCLCVCQRVLSLFLKCLCFYESPCIPLCLWLKHFQCPIGCSV